jgi:signal transduction histidine kinase
MNFSKVKNILFNTYGLVCLGYVLVSLLFIFLGGWTLSLNDDSLRRVYSFRLISRAHFQIITANSKAIYYLNSGIQQNNSELIDEGFTHLETAKGFIYSLDSELYLNNTKNTDNFYIFEYDKLISIYESLLDRDLTSEDKKIALDLIEKVKVISTKLSYSESDFWKNRAIDFERIREQNDNIERVYWFLVIFFIIGLFILVYYSIAKYKLEQELEQQRLQNLASSRLASLGKFSAGVAHEINNPLTVILWRLKALRKKYVDLDPNGSLDKDITSIETNTIRIDKIIKGIKTLTSNAEKDNFKDISISSIEQQLEDILAPKISFGNFKYNFVSNTPDIKVKMREVQIIQVLVNLINNSIEAIEDFDEKWIRVETKLEKKYLTYSITDSGNGLTKMSQENLFKLFYTTKFKNKKGTGIGLALSAKIIKDHNGILEYNPDHKNTQFLIKLPTQHDKGLIT